MRTATQRNLEFASLRREERNGLPYTVGELWTARQRQGHSLHEISYRACFKPQLPEFFISHYSEKGDLVFDPFMGRGSTPIQAHLMGRRAAGSDTNPLSVILTRPRMCPPPLSEIKERLAALPPPVSPPARDEELLVFYHPKVLAQLTALRRYFARREREGRLDKTDDWLRMVMLNRLTGHSPGFLSVRTMPPNQAVSVESQRRINRRSGQVPPLRNVKSVLWRKSVSLLRDGAPPPAEHEPLLSVARSDELKGIRDTSVSLIVTSPPFLDTVDYKADNWLRNRMAGIDENEFACDRLSDVSEWRGFVRRSFAEFARVVRPGGRVAFEVGEVRGGKVLLEEEVLKAVSGLPFNAETIFINQQVFTKTANCWGVSNNRKGTNSNRIVLFRREGRG
ncbi:MAG: site-specific DNA-methyltransferase [Alphaproteobacteria bacterium]|nr:site-specific DNA-methyltransferase [Alphaproteobacteria bacterium]